MVSNSSNCNEIFGEYDEMKKDNILWKKIKFYLIIGIILYLGFYIFFQVTSDEAKCRAEGYDGTVTMLGLPLHQCYIDNRPDSMNNVKYYPMFP